MRSLSIVLQILPLHPVPDVPEELVDLGGRKAEAGGDGSDAIAVEMLRDLPFQCELVVQISVALVTLDDVPGFLHLDRHHINVGGCTVLNLVRDRRLLEGLESFVTAAWTSF